MSNGATAAHDAAASTPSLTRRFACGLYEGVMLFGVGLVPAVLSTLATRLIGGSTVARWAPQIIGLLCFGTYFVWLWTRSGQTLPMQTWRIKLVDAHDGHLLDWRRALYRYLLCWLWIAPGVLIGMVAGWSKWPLLGAAGAWAAAYGFASRFLPDRQFLHDRLAGTRLVNAEAARGPAAR